MISNNRADYASADEWLSALKHDEAWLGKLQLLQNSTPVDVKKHRDMAYEKIGKGLAYGHWDTYNHQVEKVVWELWDAGLTLPNLKNQTIGMLTLEWLEQHAVDKTAQAEEAAFLDKLSLCFKNNDEARRFLTSIREMNNTDTVRLAKKYRDNDLCTDISKNLWKLLYDAGLYKASYQNWNNQMNKR